jgi:hypothetical protein
VSAQHLSSLQRRITVDVRQRSNPVQVTEVPSSSATIMSHRQADRPRELDDNTATVRQHVLTEHILFPALVVGLRDVEIEDLHPGVIDQQEILGTGVSRWATRIDATTNTHQTIRFFMLPPVEFCDSPAADAHPDFVCECYLFRPTGTTRSPAGSSPDLGPPTHGMRTSPSCPPDQIPELFPVRSRCPCAGWSPRHHCSPWCSGHPARCGAATPEVTTAARAGSPRHPSRAAKDRTPATPDIGDTRDGHRASAEEVPRNARGGASHRQKNFATRSGRSSTLLTVANRRQPPRSQVIPERGSFATISGRGPMNSAPAAPRIGGLDRRRSQGVSRSRYPSWARTTTPGRATRTLTRCQRPSPRRLDG